MYVPFFVLHIIHIQPVHCQNPLTLTLDKLGSVYHMISQPCVLFHVTYSTNNYPLKTIPAQCTITQMHYQISFKILPSQLQAVRHLFLSSDKHILQLTTCHCMPWPH